MLFKYLTKAIQVTAILLTVQSNANAEDFDRKNAVEETVLIEVGDGYQWITYHQTADGLAILDGDIILGTHEELQSRQAELLVELALEIPLSLIKNREVLKWIEAAQGTASNLEKGAFHGIEKKWSSNTLTYRLSPSLTTEVRKKIRAAVKIWNNSGVNLLIMETKSHNITWKDLFIAPPLNKTFCRSHIGAPTKLKKKFMEIASTCSVGSIVHEFFHSAGFIHEHQRKDNGTYLRWENTTGNAGNLQGLDKVENITGYDICSISHYAAQTAWGTHRFGLTKVGEAAKKECSQDFSLSTTLPGQRIRLSQGDIETINRVYK